jgi:ribosomal protein S6
MENQDKDKKEYELGVLVETEDDLAGVVAILRTHNAEMVSEPRAKKLALAYPIEKHKEAFFASCNFKAFGDEVKALEKDLKMKPEVIRSLIIHAMEFSQPSERPTASMGAMKRRPASSSSSRPTPSASAPEPRPSSQPLSNEALEKKIEEILK